jgi:DUF971 family protein
MRESYFARIGIFDQDSTQGHGGTVLAMPVTAVDIDVDRAHAVTITFDDGAVCRYELVELRQACPCATCRNLRDNGQESWPRPGSAEPLAIEDAELVGAWGISFTWNDGHNTGIYPWDALRSWCDTEA